MPKFIILKCTLIIIKTRNSTPKIDLWEYYYKCILQKKETKTK